MDEATLTRLREAGWFVYRFIDGTVRFMCSWATTAEAVDEIAAAVMHAARAAPTVQRLPAGGR